MHSHWPKGKAQMDFNEALKDISAGMIMLSFKMEELAFESFKERPDTVVEFLEECKILRTEMDTVFEWLSDVGQKRQDITL